MRTTIPVVMLCLMTTCALAADSPATAPATTQRTVLPSETYTDVIPRDQLMVGGVMTPDPLDASLKYYFSPEYLSWQHPDNLRRSPGILMSRDGGLTWRTLSRSFEYEHFFVHPITGKLYAIVRYEWQQEDRDGFLTRCFANKVVMSDDGRRWKDITRGNGFVAELESIFQDPDHPNRVCVGANAIRYCVMQTKDDNYSEWNWFHGGDWHKAHPTTRPAGQ